eukprot:1989119-Alexandrium_andersonii.AAC.1
MSASLVGSEMCIRDRNYRPAEEDIRACAGILDEMVGHDWAVKCEDLESCLLYTSDAADDM